MVQVKHVTKGSGQCELLTTVNNITVTMYISIQSLKIVMAEPLKNKLPRVILSLLHLYI